MNIAIILTILILLIGIKIISSIWKSGMKEVDEYNKLASNPEYREAQLQKYLKLFANGEDKNSELIYKIARINLLTDNYSDAVQYLKLYLELNPDDAEGFAELADTYSRQDDITNAKAAIERAIELEGEYEDYREQQLRIGIQANDITYAENASTEWMRLDEKRVKLNKRPHRWSPMYQIGPKHATADIAIKSYLTALLYLKNEKSAAREVIDNMNKEEEECLKILIEEDELFSQFKDIYDA